MTTLALSFLAGLLTILSPCVLPLAPLVVAASRAKNVAGPLALAGGLALSFGLVGGALAAAGVEAGDSFALRAISSVALILAGVALLSPALQAGIERVLAPLGPLSGALERRLPAGLIGQAALGAVLALAWAPCAGPTLGAAFALAASGGSRGFAMVSMAIFALGAAASLLAVGFGLGRLAALGRARARLAVAGARAAFGAALVAVGLAVLTGFDHRLEAWALSAMPDWLVAFSAQI
jgi:cytochrome c-type biogenesis protein